MMAIRGGKVTFKQPSEIRYTQDSVSPNFRDGNTLNGTLESLERGDMQKRDIPMIRVAKHEGQLYSLDNRRLKIFRELEAKGICKYIKVDSVPKNTEFHKKFTTGNDGASVRVRQGKAHYVELSVRSLHVLKLPSLFDSKV